MLRILQWQLLSQFVCFSWLLFARQQEALPRGVYTQGCPFFLCGVLVLIQAVNVLYGERDAGSSKARRRRDRWLQVWHRQGKLTVAMKLATALQHSAQPRPVVEEPRGEEVHETHDAPRRLKTPRPGTAGAEYFTMFDDEAAPAEGTRPERCSTGGCKHSKRAEVVRSSLRRDRCRQPQREKHRRGNFTGKDSCCPVSEGLVAKKGIDRSSAKHDEVGDCFHQGMRLSDNNNNGCHD